MGSLWSCASVHVYETTCTCDSVCERMCACECVGGQRWEIRTERSGKELRTEQVSRR